jgi:hypothetical protein
VIVHQEAREIAQSDGNPSLSPASVIHQHPVTRDNTNDVLSPEMNMCRLGSFPSQPGYADGTDVGQANSLLLHDTNLYHAFSFSVTNSSPYVLEMKHLASQDPNTSSRVIVGQDYVSWPPLQGQAHQCAESSLAGTNGTVRYPRAAESGLTSASISEEVNMMHDGLIADGSFGSATASTQYGGTFHNAAGQPATVARYQSRMRPSQIATDQSHNMRRVQSAPDFPSRTDSFTYATVSPGFNNADPAITHHLQSDLASRHLQSDLASHGRFVDVPNAFHFSEAYGQTRPTSGHSQQWEQFGSGPVKLNNSALKATVPSENGRASEFSRITRASGPLYMPNGNLSWYDSGSICLPDYDIVDMPQYPYQAICDQPTQWYPPGSMFQRDLAVQTTGSGDFYPDITTGQVGHMSPWMSEDQPGMTALHSGNATASALGIQTGIGAYCGDGMAMPVTSGGVQDAWMAIRPEERGHPPKDDEIGFDSGEPKIQPRRHPQGQPLECPYDDCTKTFRTDCNLKYGLWSSSRLLLTLIQDSIRRLIPNHMRVPTAAKDSVRKGTNNDTSKLIRPLSSSRARTQDVTLNLPQGKTVYVGT